MFGEKLRNIRLKLEMSQEEFSKKTGITYRAYTSYERGDRKPSFEFLKELALKFDVNLNWLIAEKGAAFLPQNGELENFKKEVLNDVKALLEQKGL